MHTPLSLLTMFPLSITMSHGIFTSKPNQLIVVHKRNKITNVALLIYPGQLKQVTGTQ